MTRFRIRYNIFSNFHDSPEIFATFAEADEFLAEHGDIDTDAVISWPDTDDEEQ